MKNIGFLILASCLLSGCGVSTGLDPVDDVLSPRKTYVQDYRFINSSSEDLTFTGYIRQAIDYARCYGYGQTSKRDLVPGERVDMHLSLQCRQKVLYREIKITRHGDYSTGTLYINAQDITKLPVGSKFKILSRDRARSFDITVVDNTDRLDSGNTTYWPAPSVLAPGVAWISKNQLFIAIPSSISQEADVAFPKILGLSRFGPYEVHEEGDYYVSYFDYSEGISIYPAVLGENTEITCDSIGCTSRLY